MIVAVNTNLAGSDLPASEYREPALPREVSLVLNMVTGSIRMVRRDGMTAILIPAYGGSEWLADDPTDTTLYVLRDAVRATLEV